MVCDAGCSFAGPDGTSEATAPLPRHPSDRSERDGGAGEVSSPTHRGQDMQHPGGGLAEPTPSLAGRVLAGSEPVGAAT